MMEIFIAVLGVLFMIFLGWMLMSDDSRKINGIYTQPNKYYQFKFYFFSVVLWLRKKQNAKSITAPQGRPGYGLRSRNSPELMEVIQDLPADQPKAVDAVYFNGGNCEGQYFVAATARRQNNFIQTLLYLRVPGLGVFEIPSKPDTKLKATEPNAFVTSGLRIQMIEPMKTWKITYDGQMRQRDTQKLFDTTMNLTWTATTKYFDFDTDLHSNVMADAIAREKWSKEFFDVLKKMHQTHYEQFGRIEGEVNIKGLTSFQLNVHGVRDHSYGNIRDWRFFYRYSINYLTLSDKTSICIGAICMPMTMSRLIIGYVFHPDGSCDPVSSSEYEHFNDIQPKKKPSDRTISFINADGSLEPMASSECGYYLDEEPKKEHSYRFEAGNKHYNLSLKVLEGPIFFIGEGRDARIHERFCQFEVNGVKGWGISECEFRNVKFSDKFNQE